MYTAWLNGTRFNCETAGEAKEIFERRHDASTLLEKAAAHFRGGWQGNTNDAFYAAVLKAYGLEIPEYPDALRQQHRERAARFWRGVAHTAGQLAGAAVQMSRQESLLEEGRAQADASE